jgi:nucleoside-diphosphate-sugar epimerase
MRKIVLITGIAGFIGNNIARRILEGEKYHVIGIDNFETGKRENIEDILPRIHFVECDIADPESVEAIVRDVDVVLHQAAIPSVQRSVKDPVRTNRANVTGTLTLLEAARKWRIQRFVYAASSSAYGDTPTLPKVETMPARPLSPYAVQKLTGELYCRAYAGCFNISTIALRYFNVFGPRQDPFSPYAAVIPRFIRAFQNNESPVINGDGDQSRDFTFIENVVTANLLAMESTHGAGECVNIACGARTTINDLFINLQQIYDSSIFPKYQPAQPGDVKHSLADIGKAKQLIGYEPRVTFEEGLRRTVDWFESRRAESGVRKTGTA